MKNSSFSLIEPLEARIAPAVVFVTFQDVDGDKVKVTSDRGTAGDLSSAISRIPTGIGFKINSIDLGATFAGAKISVTATKANGGDGLVNVGTINALGFDLDSVTVQGDVGTITAGDTTLTTSAMRALTVDSLGAQGIQSGQVDLISGIDGSIDTVTVHHDIRGWLRLGGFVGSTIVSNIGKLVVGGSIVGDQQGSDGHVQTDGNIGPITIGGDIKGSGPHSGIVEAGGNIASLSLKGSLVGGTDVNGDSGVIRSGGACGPVSIGGDIVGTGPNTGLLNISYGSIQSLTIKGSVIGGTGELSGEILSAQLASSGSGLVKIGKDVRGGTGSSSGVIKGFFSGISIGGSLIGDSGEPSMSTGNGSGQLIGYAKLGQVKIGGDIQGGKGENSGAITEMVGDGQVSVQVAGSVRGGIGSGSGSISSQSGMGPIKIGGDLVGNDGSSSGNISTPSGDMSELTIGGSVKGGRGARSGLISSAGAISAVKIGGDLTGNDGDYSGEIYAGMGIAGGVTIGGSMTGGNNHNTSFSGTIRAGGDIGPIAIGKLLLGGAAELSGYIHAGGNMGSVKIGGDLQGGSGGFSGEIHAEGNIAGLSVGGSLIGGASTAYDAGFVWANGDMGKVTIIGSMVGGAGRDNGSIFAFNLGPVKIGKDMTGDAGESSGAIIAGGTLASVTVGGGLSGGDGAKSARIESAGNLGPVKIGKDIVGGDAGTGAGVVFTTPGKGGNIASIKVGGALLGGADGCGRIYADGNLGVVSIGKDVAGGIGSFSGYIQGASIASVSIGGSLKATPGSFGTFNHDGWVSALHEIGSITVKGSILGDGTNAAVISAGGATTPTATSDVAIRTLSVSHDVTHGEIRGGYEPLQTFHDANAQIGTVRVGGAWMLSRLSSGAAPGTDGISGTADDGLTGTISQIASIVIHGVLTGGAAGQYAITSGKVGSLSAAGTRQPLTTGPDNLDLGGITVRDVR